MTDDSNDPFVVLQPDGPRLPILISIPHCGTEFPPELQDRFLPEILEYPDDTDWFVHSLYDFCERHGVTIIQSRYSRYVIDLNRDPAGQNLYDDGRTETGLLPDKTFAGAPLYKDGRGPTPCEVEERLLKYFVPYYRKIESVLRELRLTSRQVMLWDAHSIPRHVPSVRAEPFPDLMLGNQDGKTAHPKLVELALAKLSRGNRFKVANNNPFKGGYITRYFGKPANRVHALQLEMSQDVYLDPEKGTFDSARAERIQPILHDTIMSLAELLRRFP